MTALGEKYFVQLSRCAYFGDYWFAKMKLKFGLIWLFALAAIVAIASSRQAKRHETLALELDQLKGCLLYTSPSPRDKRQSRMPSSA